MFLTNNNTTVWCVDFTGSYAGNAILPVMVPPPMPQANNVSLSLRNPQTNVRSLVNPKQLMLCDLNALNPGAVEFIPTPPCTPPYSPLVPIQEEKEMKSPKTLMQWQSQQLYSLQHILKCKYIIYIPTQATKAAIDNEFFDEYFATDSDLFYHLRYQCKMQVIDRLYRRFTCYDQELVIFNTELHSSKRNQTSQVFIVGQPNDKGKNNAVKWKMIAFMTAQEIDQTYNIKQEALPRGSRDRLHAQFLNNMFKYKRDVGTFINSMQLNMDTMKSLNKIGQIKSETNGAQPLIVTFQQLFQCMRDSIQRNVLRPIVWFSNNKQNPTYRIQMVLPIELEDGNCIGITFDYDDQGQLCPVKFCIDDVDMRRKLTLYKPCGNANEYGVFSNSISEIYITNDSAQQLIWNQTERIKSLERMMREKENEIEELRKRLNGGS